MRLKMSMFAMIALACVALPAAAQPYPGDPKAGLEFARKLCADCHYVEAIWSGYSPAGAPSLGDIAVKPEWTALTFRVFLQSPHESMPDFILSRSEADDVISYLLSLKSAKTE